MIFANWLATFDDESAVYASSVQGHGFPGSANSGEGRGEDRDVPRKPRETGNHCATDWTSGLFSLARRRLAGRLFIDDSDPDLTLMIIERVAHRGEVYER